MPVSPLISSLPRPVALEPAVGVALVAAGERVAHGLVVAGPGRKVVVAVAGGAARLGERVADDDVVARAPVHLVVAAARGVAVLGVVVPDDDVVAATARDVVVPGIADDQLVALAAGDDVVTRAGVDAVVAGAAADQVIAVATDDDVVTGAGREHLGPAAARPQDVALAGAAHRGPGAVAARSCGAGLALRLPAAERGEGSGSRQAGGRRDDRSPRPTDRRSSPRTSGRPW